MVEKSGEKVFQDGRLHASFQRLARVVASPIILAHIRYRSSGQVDECHAHPFSLDFWGQSWIFAHNGEARAIEPYRSRHTPTLEASSDSARTFEFLRDYFVDAVPRRQYTPFRQILQEALSALIGNIPVNITFSSPMAAFSGPSPTTGSFCCSRAARSWKTPCCSPPSKRASARKTGRKLVSGKGAGARSC